MRRMKGGKAVGEDGIAKEMLPALHGFSIKKMTSIANKIYQSGEVNEDVPINTCNYPKKIRHFIECNKLRRISILSQTLKLILRNVLKRIRSKIKWKFSDEHYGFVDGKRTRNVIFILRL